MEKNLIGKFAFIAVLAIVAAWTLNPLRKL